MDADPPKSPREHPSFHKRTMVGALGIVLIAAIAFGIGALLEERNQSGHWAHGAAMAAFAICVVWLVGYFLYRAAFAKPDCPNCGQIAKDLGTTAVIAGGNWRCHRCRSCGHEFRVPAF